VLLFQADPLCAVSRQLTLCVGDGELVSSVSVNAKAVPGKPVISFQSVGPLVSVPSGSINFAITIVASSLPTPNYQWQYMVMELTNSTTNDTLDDTSATALDARWQDDFDYAGHSDLIPRAGNATLQPVPTPQRPTRTRPPSRR
jgi:hypothetical protein